MKDIEITHKKNRIKFILHTIKSLPVELQLVFIILKLTKIISWSWWIVLLPLYSPIIIASTIYLIGLTLYLIISVIEYVYLGYKNNKH